MKKALSLNPEGSAFHELLITELKERDRLGELEAFSGEIAQMIADPKSIPIFYFECATTLLGLEIFPQALLIFRKIMEKAREEFEYIIQNELEENPTYSNYLLVLYHLDEDKELINQYKESVEGSLGSNGDTLSSMYNIDLKLTQAILERDDIDEKTRQFNTKKFEGINFILSFIIEKGTILNQEPETDPIDDYF